MPCIRALIVSSFGRVLLSTSVDAVASPTPTTNATPSFSSSPKRPGSNDPSSLQSHHLGRILATLRSFPSSSSSKAPAILSHTFEVELGDVHVTVHDGGIDPHTAVLSPTASVAGEAPASSFG